MPIGVLNSVNVVRVALWLFVCAAFFLVFNEIRSSYSTPFKLYIYLVAFTPLLLTGMVQFYLDNKKPSITGVGVQWAITLLVLFLTQIQDVVKDYQWTVFEALDNNRLVFHVLFSIFYAGIGAALSLPFTKNLSVRARATCTMCCGVIVFAIVHI